MPSRNAATARQVWWASVPVWSIGFLSPVPFLAYAVITRTRRDWAVFAGYLAATVAMIIALSATKEGTAPNDAVGLFIVALAGCAAAHAAVLFRPSRGVTAGAAPGSLSTRQRNELRDLMIFTGAWQVHGVGVGAGRLGGGRRRA